MTLGDQFRVFDENIALLSQLSQSKGNSADVLSEMWLIFWKSYNWCNESTVIGCDL